MRINSLELKWIRSYDEEKIEFPQGSVLLSGDIGHGKSTLLLAIEFGLFGIQRGELTGDEILREGKDRGSVKLCFTIDEAEYTVMRSLKRTGDNVTQDSGYLLKDGVKEDLQPGELKAKILEILGYPKELITKQRSYIYRYTVYTPQEEMKSIIFEDEENRLEILRKIFGISKYKIIRDNVSTVRTELRGYNRQLAGIADGIDDDRGELKGLEKEIKDIEKNLGDAKKNRNQIEKQLSGEKGKLRVIRDNLKTFNTLRNKGTGAKAKKESEDGKLERHKESVEKIMGKIKQLKELKQPTKLTEEELEKKIDNLNEKKETYLKDKKGISKEIDSLIKKIDEGKTQLEKFDEKVNASKGIIKQLEKSIEELEQAGNKCPVCGSELTKTHKDKEIKKNRDKIEDENKKIKTNKNKKKELEQNIVEWKEAAGAEVEKVIDKINEELQKLTDLTKELGSYNQSIKRIKEYEGEIKEKDEEKKEIITSIKELEKELIEIDKSLKEYEGIEEKEKKFNEKVEEIQRKFNEADRIYTGAETDIKNKSGYVERIKKEIMKKENAKKLSEKISEYENWLDAYLSNLASTIERHFMLHLQKKFNSVFGGWFNQLVDDENLSVRVNDRFTPVIEREGYETLYRHLSGGEKTSIALAYRLGLNTVINSLINEIKTKDLIILDEPTDGFSSNQLDKVRDVINELGAKQTILVSHEPKMEGYVEHILNVYKENGVSHVRC